MPMYDELLNNLRVCAVSDECENCGLVSVEHCRKSLLEEAAGAIVMLESELKKAKTESNNYRKALEALDGAKR